MIKILKLPIDTPNVHGTYSIKDSIKQYLKAK